MSFTCFSFLAIFLPITFFVYCLCSKVRILQNIVLLAASYAFYYFYGIDNVVFLIVSTLITFFGGLAGYLLTKRNKVKIGKFVYIVAAVLNLSMLVVFKYLGFAVENINGVLGKFGAGPVNLPALLLPVGLSFFIFQSSSYLFDLMQGKREPEKNIIDYALFVSFFPTIVSGPIQRSTVFLPQIKERRPLKFENIQKAVFVFLWGAFVKMVIADRIALFTNTVFGNYQGYKGIVLAAAAFAYAIQIYADFAGYSYMAIGCSALFGFDLPDNFKQPYLATSIPDFWRRWHISLTSWFRDYLYIPLGGNRKGTFRKYLNILIIFLVSGLWHGASWNFILWGVIHAAYQIVGQLTLNGRKNLCSVLGVNRESGCYRLWQRVSVFLMTTFAWIFFRIGKFGDAVEYIKLIFAEWNPWVLTKATLFNIGLDPVEWNVILVSVALLLVVSLYREKGKNCKDIIKQNAPFRIVCCVSLILAIVIFGMYGPDFSASSFIYAGF